jgi:hypothetical protein
VNLDIIFLIVGAVCVVTAIVVVGIIWWAVRSLEISLQYELNLYGGRNYEADSQVQYPSTERHRDHDA